MLIFATKATPLLNLLDEIIPNGVLESPDNAFMGIFINDWTLQFNRLTLVNDTEGNLIPASMTTMESTSMGSVENIGCCFNKPELFKGWLKSSIEPNDERACTCCIDEDFIIFSHQGNNIKFRRITDERFIEQFCQFIPQINNEQQCCTVLKRYDINVLMSRLEIIYTASLPIKYFTIDEEGYKSCGPDTQVKYTKSVHSSVPMSFITQELIRFLKNTLYCNSTDVTITLSVTQCIVLICNNGVCFYQAPCL